jgi:hypothetical protein
MMTNEKIMKTTFQAFLFFVLHTNLFANPIDLDQDGWPRDLAFKKGVITIYQPQIESFEKNKIEARAALAIKQKDKVPVFGAMWFSCRAVTDLDNHMVLFDEIKVESLKFPEGDEEQVENIKKAMMEKLDGISMTISLERFTASIAHLEDQGANNENFNNEPPVIYFETDPAVLVFIDGDPILKEVENSEIKYVMNTPFFLVQHPQSNLYYLKGGEWWYSSKEIEKGWKSIEYPPQDVEKLSEQAFKGETKDLDSLTIEMDQAPKLIVSTEPAELIQTDGEPKFEPITGTDLLFLTNSESDIIMDINSQQYYILISGRWYNTKQLDAGNWKYIAADDLPEDFTKIPGSSDIADVLYSVPGTPEAKDAILENSIPQTAEVDRKKSTVEVQYDGNPKFSKIESTSVSYAENSDKTVLLINSKYYCVDDAIWFVSSKATGPWEVCVEVPDEVQDIPPSSPVYNVKYVYVYDYTPSVVYVGYTPGYYGSYVYYGRVVYGTGYWYNPWYHTYYYPRPVTWGFGVHYNPWTGWGFSYGVSYGWISFGWHSYYHGWWGPCGYRYGYRHGYYRGYQHGYRHGYWHGYASGRRAGYVASNRPSTRPVQSNIYRNRDNGIRNTGVRPSTRPAMPTTRPSTRPTAPESRPSTRPVTPEARPSSRPSTPSAGSRPSTRENNIYSDKNGNIYRRDNTGSWQQRDNGQWNGGSRQSTPSQNLNRDFNNRTRGNQRANTYSNRSTQPAAPRARPSGGGRRQR